MPYTALENRYTSGYRGFESHSLRHILKLNTLFFNDWLSRSMNPKSRNADILPTFHYDAHLDYSSLLYPHCPSHPFLKLERRFLLKPRQDMGIGI